MKTQTSELKNPSKEVRTENGKADHTRGLVFEPRVDIAEVEDNLNAAYALSQTKTVASNLGITTTALNNGFRAARKTLIAAQIDKALAAGAITADEAAALKAKLAAATIPGYKALGGLGGYGNH